MSLRGRVTMDASTFLSSLETDSVGCMITDPPWELSSGGRFGAAADYDLEDPTDLVHTLQDAQRALIPGGHAYIFAPAGSALYTIADTLRSTGWRIMRTLAWDKGFREGLGAYRNAWEPVLLCSHTKPRPFIGTRCSHPSLLSYPAPRGRTQKPWQLYAIFLDMSSKPDELVIDPFCGSDPLGQAIARMNRGQPYASGDVLTEQQVADSLRNRPWRETGPLGDDARYHIQRPPGQEQTRLEVDPDA